jgi:hypothetical protein
MKEDTIIIDGEAIPTAVKIGDVKTTWTEQVEHNWGSRVDWSKGEIHPSTVNG